MFGRRRELPSIAMRDQETAEQDGSVNELEYKLANEADY
jgi:hypothetical protein